MTVLAPEKEWELAHFRFDFQSLCRILFSFSLLCTLVAIYFSALPKGPLKGENEWWDLNHTKWLVKNVHFRYFENGTIYWKNPENGEIYIPYDQNYMKMSIAGYDPYYFGSTHQNFCFEREEIPKSEWTGSLFRGMMLDASIMTLFRTCFLISMVPRVLYRWIISKKSYLEKKKFSRAFIGVLGFINELFYYIAFYFFTMFQIWNDSMLEVTYSRTWFLMAFISLLNKLAINGVLRICPLRDRRIQWCIICVTIMCYPVIAYDMDSYQKGQYCDAMVHPLITLAQLVFVGIICMNSWIELRHSKDYIILASTEEEDLPQIQNYMTPIMQENNKITILGPLF